MKNKSGSRSAEKRALIITETITQSKQIELQSKTIEEQRLKLALELRMMNINNITKN